jgi:hypothetical protein
LHFGDAHAVVAVELDGSSSGVDADDGQGPGLLAPLVSVAQTKNDDILNEGEGRHDFISDFLEERRLEKEIDFFDADETSSINAQLV